MPLHVTDAAGEQTAAAAPLNKLLNAGPCPHCGEAASKSIMEVVRKHGKQSNDLHVQELMQLAMATPKSTVIRSHNTFNYKIGVQCTCCKQVYAEVDTDFSSTGVQRTTQPACIGFHRPPADNFVWGFSLKSAAVELGMNVSTHCVMRDVGVLGFLP